MSELVSNQPPKVDPGSVRLAVIGESPGLGEVSWRVCPNGHGFEGQSWKRGVKVETVTCPSCGSAKWQPSPQPFKGPSGRMLDWLLREAGLTRDRCFIGNAAPRLCSPEELNKPDGVALRVGHSLLCDELAAFKPNCVLLLGNTALRMFHPWRWSAAPAAANESVASTDLLGEVEREPESVAAEPACKITDWRGSIFAAGPLSPLPGVKCVAAFHPAAVLRQPDWQPLLEFDVRRAVVEATTPDLNLPQRNVVLHARAETVCYALHELLPFRTPLAVDIEGYCTTGVTLISFAWTATDVLSVPLRHADGSPWWSPGDEQAIMDALRAVLEDPNVPKAGHNLLYEAFVLRWAHRIHLRGIVGDTMLGVAEAFPELEKALEVAASIFTRQPYWKHGRDAQDDATAIEYNATDSCVTWEIDRALHGTNPATGQPYLTDGQLAHYAFNLSLLEPLNEMMLRGLRFDEAGRDALVATLRSEINALNGELDALAGILAPALEEVAAALCLKRRQAEIWTWDDVVENAKPTCKEKAKRVIDLMEPLDEPASPASVGELNALLERGVNVASPSLKSFLYDPPPKGCGFEPQYIKEGNRNTTRLARDTGALLSLLRKHPGDRRLELCLALINRQTQLKQLQMKVDLDERVRYSANIVGTKTQRHTCHESNTGSGGNFHSTPDNHKHLFLADEGCDLWNVDLAGADGWTLGCEMSALGDNRMLEDLRAGVKPAAAVALLYKWGADANKWSYENLKANLPGIKDPPWLYYTCKKAVWGCCLSRKHEVLTPTGWQRIDRLPEGWPVATWKNGFIRWSVPKRLIRQQHTGQLIRFVGNSYDLEVTPDHRMPYLQSGKGWAVCTAEELAKRDDARLPLSGSWQEGRHEPLAELIAAIQSDGHYTKDGALAFCLRKQRKIDRIQDLLKRAGLDFRVSPFRKTKDGLDELTVYCYNPPKVPKEAGTWMLSWNEGSLRRYCNEYVFWDGSVGKARKIRAVFNKSKEHLLWFGLFRRLTSSGFCYRGSSGRCHRLSLNRRTMARLGSMRVLRRKVFNQPVFCMETEDGFFLVRRANKIMVTGNCYGLGELTLSQSIMEDSYKDTGMAIYVDTRTCRSLLALVHARYPGIRRRQQRIAMLLERDGYLDAPNGSRRIFFGRASDSATLRDAYAHTPQVCTTWVTSLAWSKMWRDRDNTRRDGTRVAMPVLLVHDAILFQAPSTAREWVEAKLPRWFANPVTIAGTTVTIPYGATRGPSWGQQELL